MSYEIKNVYTIFFASSITELELERLKLTNFVNGLSAHYLEKFFEIRLLPIICEDEDPCMVHAGKQAEYDQAIRDSRMCFFVFYKKVGEYTVHELEVAKAAFDSTELPKIYFFFKKPHGEEFSSEVVGLQSKLDKDFGHYYNFFDDIDTVHLRIVLQIMEQVLPEVSVKLKDGKVTANDLPIPGVDPMSLPEFKNNRDLARLREEYDELAAECEALSEEFKQPNCPTAIIEDYARKAARKASLQEEIRQLLDNIFNISKEICSESGAVDVKRRAAYHYLEEGDSKKALELLDAGELSEASNRLLSRADMMDAEAQSLVDSWKLRIDILLTMTEDSQRFEKARAAYETIEKLVDKFRIGTEKILDYALFLYRQNDHGLAYDKALQYVRLLEVEKSLGKAVADETLGVAYNLAGATARNLQVYDKAPGHYKNALEIRKRLYAKNSSAYALNLAETCNNLGLLYYDLKRYGNALKYYEEALRILEEHTQENPSAYAPYLASLSNNFGSLYYNLKQYDEAQGCYKEAIGIRKKLYEENPAAYASDLAVTYNNFGMLCRDLKKYNEAQGYYKEAIRIQKELYEENPFANASDLALTYNNLGLLYYDLKRYGNAQKYYEEALGIRKKLYAETPSAYASDLAVSYNNLGWLHIALKEYSKALKYHKDAIGIKEQLYKETPSAYASDLATSYNALAVLYYDLKEYGEARKYCEAALGIRKKLYAENPAAYASDLAVVYGNLAEIYKELGETELSQECLNILKSLKQ